MKKVRTCYSVVEPVDSFIKDKYSIIQNLRKRLMRIIKKLEQVVGVMSHASLLTSKCLKQCITFIRSIVVAKFQTIQINIQLLTIELVCNERTPE